MPYPNEHSARQTDPGQYDTFRRYKPSGFPKGVSVILGIKGTGKDKKSEIQSIRFDKKLWTVEAAKKWLKEHGFKTGKFEPAAGSKKTAKGVSGLVVLDTDVITKVEKCECNKCGHKIEKMASDIPCEKTVCPVCNAVMCGCKNVTKEVGDQGQGQGGQPQGTGGYNFCVCTKCGHKIQHQKGVPCNKTACPKCGGSMTGTNA